MNRKTTILLFIFVVLLWGIACNKKQAEPTQASQASPAQQPAAQQATSAPPAQPSTPQTQLAPATANTSPAPNAPTEKHKLATVPSGTALVVRLNNAISSKTAQPGQTFSGTLAKPIVVGGEKVIPAGAEVTGRVTEVKAAGKLMGAAQLALTLTSLSSGGQTYEVSSQAISQTGKGKGKRTAVLGGGGAGLGAVVGGLAGGGKGAVIGMLAGGGAGTAGSVFTGDADITLPAEAALSFRLSQPLDLNAGQALNASK